MGIYEAIASNPRMLIGLIAVALAGLVGLIALGYLVYAYVKKLWPFREL